jgi:tRNA-dependent cyclodipeptide synthase
MITVVPLTDRCSEIVEQGEHVVVGLSPFNSYYKAHTIESLIGWAVNTFASVDVLLPGYQATYTMIAAGLEPRAAARRTRRVIGRLGAPALRVLRSEGVTEPERRVQTWTQMAGRARYRAVHRRARDAYREHPQLQELCRQLSAAALSAAGAQNTPQEDIARMTDYVIAELPFFVDSPGIYGTASSVFAYHRSMDTVDLLFTRSVPMLCPVAGQAYATVTVAPDDPSTNPLAIATATAQ